LSRFPEIPELKNNSEHGSNPSSEINREVWDLSVRAILERKKEDGRKKIEEEGGRREKRKRKEGGGERRGEKREERGERREERGERKERGERREERGRRRGWSGEGRRTHMNGSPSFWMTVEGDSRLPIFSNDHRLY
jgi:hypothetical protein